MITTLTHPELATYIAAYDRENRSQNGEDAPSLLSFYKGVEVVSNLLEVIDRLRSNSVNEMTREEVWGNGPFVTGHFLHLFHETDGGRILFFVPSETAQKVLPLLQPDGGGGTPLGSIEHFHI